MSVGAKVGLVEDRLALGVGVGLSADLDRWVILPEIGYSVCLDNTEVGPVFSYGLSLVFLPAP